MVLKFDQFSKFPLVGAKDLLKRIDSTALTSGQNACVPLPHLSLLPASGCGAPGVQSFTRDQNLTTSGQTGPVRQHPSSCRPVLAPAVRRRRAGVGPRVCYVCLGPTRLTRPRPRRRAPPDQESAAGRWSNSAGIWSISGRAWSKNIVALLRMARRAHARAHTFSIIADEGRCAHAGDDGRLQVVYATLDVEDLGVGGY